MLPLFLTFQIALNLDLINFFHGMFPFSILGSEFLFFKRNWVFQNLFRNF